MNGKHWKWLRRAPDWVQGEFAQEFELMQATNADLLDVLQATHSVIEDLSDTGDLDRKGTLEFLSEAIRKAKEAR